MYKCEYKRKDCSSCLVADKLWQCGWCSLTSTCGVQENCKKPLTKKCPSPVITDVIALVEFLCSYVPYSLTHLFIHPIYIHSH